MTYNGGNCSDLVDMKLNSALHCMEESLICQTGLTVKEIAWMPIPFANRDWQRKAKFGRVSQSKGEIASNERMGVWHDFSLEVCEVRKVGTIKRKNRL